MEAFSGSTTMPNCDEAPRDDDEDGLVANWTGILLGLLPLLLLLLLLPLGLCNESLLALVVKPYTSGSSSPCHAFNCT